jgi:dCTP deaminase
MILSGSEIVRQVERRNIIIDPFELQMVNPNSYNYRLGGLLMEVDKEVSVRHVSLDECLCAIPAEGALLSPGRVYLGHTMEVIGSNKFVPSLIGRSSMGRLGLFLQLSADLGNLGSAHQWTLELACVQPVIVYPGMVVGQVSFWAPLGEIKEYEGQYTSFSCPKSYIPPEVGL